LFNLVKDIDRLNGETSSPQNHTEPSVIDTLATAVSLKIDGRLIDGLKYDELRLLIMICQIRELKKAKAHLEALKEIKTGKKVVKATPAQVAKLHGL
jgi:hypothetical protein